MDAGVGAARGMDSDQATVGAGTADGGDGGFDGILDGGASALTLPSSEGASVIGEGELESHGKWVSCRGDRGGD